MGNANEQKSGLFPTVQLKENALKSRETTLNPRMQNLIGYFTQKSLRLSLFLCLFPPLSFFLTLKKAKKTQRFILTLFCLSLQPSTKYHLDFSAPSKKNWPRILFSFIFFHQKEIFDTANIL